jgi:hypothetical protein
MKLSSHETAHARWRPRALIPADVAEATLRSLSAPDAVHIPTTEARPPLPDDSPDDSGREMTVISAIGVPWPTGGDTPFSVTDAPAASSLQMRVARDREQITPARV